MSAVLRELEQRVADRRQAETRDFLAAADKRHSTRRFDDRWNATPEERDSYAHPLVHLSIEGDDTFSDMRLTRERAADEIRFCRSVGMKVEKSADGCFCISGRVA